MCDMMKSVLAEGKSCGYAELRIYSYVGHSPKRAKKHNVTNVYVERNNKKRSREFCFHRLMRYIS